MRDYFLNARGQREAGQMGFRRGKKMQLDRWEQPADWGVTARSRKRGIRLAAAATVTDRRVLQRGGAWKPKFPKLVRIKLGAAGRRACCASRCGRSVPHAPVALAVGAVRNPQQRISDQRIAVPVIQTNLGEVGQLLDPIGHRPEMRGLGDARSQPGPWRGTPAR